MDFNGYEVQPLARCIISNKYSLSSIIGLLATVLGFFTSLVITKLFRISVVFLAVASELFKYFSEHFEHYHFTSLNTGKLSQSITKVIPRI